MHFRHKSSAVRLAVRHHRLCLLVEGLLLPLGRSRRPPQRGIDLKQFRNDVVSVETVRVGTCASLPPPKALGFRCRFRAGCLKTAVSSIKTKEFR